MNWRPSQHLQLRAPILPKGTLRQLPEPATADSAVKTANGYPDYIVAANPLSPAVVLSSLPTNTDRRCRLGREVNSRLDH